MDKWDYMKLKSCTTKEMISKLKRPSIEWKKIFASYASEKRNTGAQKTKLPENQ
jgi:hypothetical protein